MAIRVTLPYHLRVLAKIDSEVSLEVEGTPSLRSALDALEERFPTLRGSIRDHATKQRRPFIRFFACKQDLSNVDVETPLPEEVISGQEPLMVVGAMAGG